MRSSKFLRTILVTHGIASGLLLHWMVFLVSLPLAAQGAGTQTQNTRNSDGASTTVPLLVIGHGSLTIRNPQNLDVPEARAQTLHKIVQDVAADYLRVRHEKETPPLVLVLGEEGEHFTFGGLNQVDTIYLQRWNESKFIAIDVSIAVQHLLSANRLDRMLEEVSRRSDRLLPVSLEELRKASPNQPPPQLPVMGNPCIAAMTDASRSGVRCEPRAAPNNKMTSADEAINKQRP